jgi:hypothetical protein
MLVLLKVYMSAGKFALVQEYYQWPYLTSKNASSCCSKKIGLERTVCNEAV